MKEIKLGDRRLSATLLEKQVLAEQDVQRALDHYRSINGSMSIAEIVVELGMLSERRVANVIEEEFAIPIVDLYTATITPEAKSLVPAERAQALGCIPIAIDGSTLRVAMLNPLDTSTAEEVEDLVDGKFVEPYQTTRSAFRYALAVQYPELGLEVPPAQAQSDAADLGLGELLVSKSVISRDTLETALVEQEKSGELLGRLLTSKYGVSEADILKTLAEQAKLDFKEDVSDLQVQPDISALMLRPDAVRFQAVPVRIDGLEVLVVVTDPRHQKDIKDAIGRKIRLLVTTQKSWDEVFSRAYSEKSRLGEALVMEGKLDRDALKDALTVQRKMGKARPLGEVLVELGYVAQADVDAALQKQRQGAGRLEDTLVQSGKIKPEVLAKSLATQLGYAFIDPTEQAPDLNITSVIPENTARRYGVFPYRLEGNQLTVLMKDPRNILVIDDLKMWTKKDIIPAVAAEASITKLIERHYSSGSAEVDKLAEEYKIKAAETEMVDTAVDDNSIVKLMNSIIKDAFLSDASDIHIEPRQHDVIVRFRIDGTLREQMKLPKGVAPAAASRIKIMGNLDIAERRLPQDGRVRYRDKSIDVDLRLSTLPTVYGEKSVMRLLRKASDIPDIEQLGLSPDTFQRFEDVIRKPYGIFLITGPTGSGKSFSTFSILKRLATPDKNTTTIEDPVEYEIPGINQTQANPVAGLTFARALRSFLRQDPDIIMVGEIRDSETAKIATEAALTGHLVIATLHTNDAAGAVTRMDEMGVEMFNISAALIGVLAQRLVRRICEKCKTETTPDPDVLRLLEIDPASIAGKTLYKGTGCERCSGSGYKGRAGIHELMIVNDDVKHAIIQNKSATEIKIIARQGGMKTLREDGIAKAFLGLTTLEEVMNRTSE